LLPAFGLLLAGCFAADAWHKRTRARDAQTALRHDVKTWEGEGGNLPPDSSPESAESSLATSAP
jgi:hypothetical protein